MSHLPLCSRVTANKTVKLNLVDQGPLDVISETLIPDDGIVQRDTGDDDGSGDHD